MKKYVIIKLLQGEKEERLTENKREHNKVDTSNIWYQLFEQFLVIWSEGKSASPDLSG